METHFSIFAWRIPWTEDPGRLWSIGLQSWTRLKLLSMHTQRTQVLVEMMQIKIPSEPV